MATADIIRYEVKYKDRILRAGNIENVSNDTKSIPSIIEFVVTKALQANKRIKVQNLSVQIGENTYLYSSEEDSFMLSQEKAA